MSSNYTLRIGSWLWLLLFSSFLWGQSHECGYTGKSPWLTAYQNGEVAIPRQSGDSLIVGLKLHLVGTTDGVGYMNMQRMMNAVRIVQEDFAPLGIYFYIEGDIRFIANSSYYAHDFSTGRIMMSLNNQPNVVNCYIVEDSGDNCGYYTGSRDALVVAKGCLDGGDRTFSHEIGHYLSIPHPFVGWEGYYDDDNTIDTLPPPRMVGNRLVELADGSNGEEAADGFADTPADYLSFGWACNNLGFFPDSLLDPDSTKFTVPAWNIMSYVRDICLPAPGEGGFSPGQEDAMVSNVLFRNNIIRDSVAFETAPARGEDVSLLAPEDGANLFPVDELTVTLRWNAVPNADFYTIQLNGNPFFGANPLKEITVSDTSLVLTEADGLRENGRIYWRVMPINRFQPLSDFGEEVFDFRIREVVSSTYDPSLNASISIFPNPVSGTEGAINVRATELPEAEAVNLQLFGSDGRLVANNRVTPAGRQINHRWSLPALPAGIYTVVVQQGSRLSRHRVVMTR